MGFERPPQALGRGHAQPDGVLCDAFDVQLRHRGLEGVERLPESPAVLGHGEAVQQRALQVRHGHTGFADPQVLTAEEAVGLGPG